MSATPRLSREQALVEFYTRLAMQSIERVPVDEFEIMVRHSDATAPRLREDFLKHMRAKIEKELQASLRDDGLSARLAAVDECEARAWDKRAEYAGRSPDTIPREERPVLLQTLSLEQLVDCRLRGVRQAWLAELERLQGDAEARQLALKQQLAETNQRIDALLNRIDERLDQFQSAARGFDFEHVSLKPDPG